MKNFILFFLLATLVASCSKSDYKSALPANCTALMCVDVGRVKGIDNQVLLKALLFASGTDDYGIDLTEKLYLFETADGNLGFCMAVRDADHLDEALSTGKIKGAAQGASQDGIQTAVVGDAWVLAYSDASLLATGPVPVSEQRSVQNRLTRYLTQDEERSAIATPMFQRLDSIDAPMALVAQVKALPEQFAAPFMLGAPRDTDPSQVYVAASISSEEGCLLMEGSTFSLNKSIDKALHKADAVFRPLTDRYISVMPADASMGIFMNVDGKEFLPLVQSNAGLQAMLAGINAAIDMDNILRSVDGDMAVVSDDGISMVAELSHSKWLADVDYWKESCPPGGRINDWGKDSYYYTDGKTSFYFGVSADSQFFSSSSSEQANAMLKNAANPLSDTVQKHLKNSRLALVVNMNSISDATDGMLSKMLPFFKPLLGDVKTMVYCKR